MENSCACNNTAKFRLGECSGIYPIIMIMMSTFDAMKLHLENRAAPLILSDPLCNI